MDEAALSGYYDSSSPDGGASSVASKNIVSERNRRKKLNERLFALRAAVPNISKVYGHSVEKTPQIKSDIIVHFAFRKKVYS